MAWTESTVTVKGTEMVAELLGGGNLTITKAEISEVTTPPAKLAFLKEISSPIDVPVSIAYINKSENNVRVCIQIQNTGLTSDKHMRQIGIYAKTATMAETLFAIVQDETGDTIPSADDYPYFLLEFNDKISVANTDNITAFIDPASIIVTQEVLSNTLDDYTGKSEFEAHTLNSVNHITAEERTAWNTAVDTIDTVNDTLNTHIADQVKHITAEEREKWNAVNYSNTNLLINPDFRINQRGLTEYTGTAQGYTVDRWWKGFQYLPTSGDVVVTTSESGSITITNSTDQFITFAQKIENSRVLYGKTVTASARIDGVTYMATGTVLTTGKGTILRGASSSKFDFTVYQDCSIERFDFEIHIVSGVTATIDWAKLEIGSIATPFCPPDPATELAKCQRYFYRLGGLKNNFVLQGLAYSPTSMSFTYQFPVEMRTLPTLSVSKGNWRFCIQKIPYEGSRYWNNEYGFVFSVDAKFSYSQRVGINVNFDDTKSTIITAGDPVIIETNSDSDSSGNQKYPGWLDFDAEL